MDNGVFVESIKVVDEIDNMINLEGKILIYKVAHGRKNVSIDYTTDFWETYYNVAAKKSCSVSSEKDLYIFKLSTFKTPNAPLYLEFAVKCDIAGSTFWTNGYQYIYDEDVTQKEFFFNEFQPSSPADDRKECIICIEKVDPDNFINITDQCIHENNMCRECVQKHIKAEVLDKGNFNILCPEEECRELLQEQDVKRFADEETFSRYDQLNLRYALLQMPDFHWCTNQDCNSGQIHDEGDAAPIMTCEACGRKSCVLHDLPIDNNRLNCPECEKVEPTRPNEEELTVVKTKTKYFSIFKKFKPERKNHEPSQTLLELEIEERNARLKQCPVCTSKIQKSGGCDHMKCGNPRCKHEFCW
ncbi:35467_t:CDS:2, partial [Racocetra persica]